MGTDGLVIDSTAPQISAVNNKTYCDEIEITVKDDNLDKVYLNNTLVDLTDGKITVKPESFKQNIKAFDLSGNETSVDFTVNDGHEFDGGKVTTAATAAKEGIKTFTCIHCGETKTEKIEKTNPVIIDGKDQKFVRADKKTLSFRSDAALADFLNVTVDGEIIDSKYYTTAEGSTIINLTQEYLSTLSDGVHTLGIVSLSGTAVTTFTISAVSEIPGELSPKTGENTDYSLAIILLVSAILLIGGTTVYARKKKSK